MSRVSTIEEGIDGHDQTVQTIPIRSHAIANLVDNAIKYSGSPSLIELKLEHTTSEIVIRIRDQGIGIKGDELERVQERFYRAKNASTANGSGRCKRTNTL
ncbi:ATP-binding protein [Paenibacillus sp. FSL M7-1414]|uniref:ATP-binding protein n=1 Tax=unclassified Paenibacillus TaxID=185978 RepID=UPI0030F4D2AB